MYGLAATHLPYLPTRLLALVYVPTPDTDSVFRAWQDTSVSVFFAGRSFCELLLLVTWVVLDRTGHSCSGSTQSGMGMVHVLHLNMEDDAEKSRRISRSQRMGGSTSTSSVAFTSFLAIPTGQDALTACRSRETLARIVVAML